MTDGGIEDAVRRGDPDRWLATRFIGDSRRRAEVICVYAFDLELARAPRVTSSPLTAEIRLAWWSEVLDEIFSGVPVRSHPVAQALSAVVRGHDLARAPLDAMIEGRRAQLFTSSLDGSGALTWADDVAGSTAFLAARILDCDAPEEPVRLAGRVFGLALLMKLGILSPDIGAPLVIDSLNAANRQLGTLRARAFPAVAAATLARRGQKAGASEVSRRLRLVWAAARGRI